MQTILLIGYLQAIKMLIVSKIECDNIRELTKKEKFLRLNTTSWAICFFGSAIPMSYIGLVNTIIIFFSLLLFFYIVEFFDDDISDIVLANLKLQSGVPKYYA